VQAEKENVTSEIQGVQDNRGMFPGSDAIDSIVNAGLSDVSVGNVMDNIEKRLVGEGMGFDLPSNTE